MFVKNDTSERIALARGHLSERLAAGVIVVETVYRVLPDRLARTDEPPPRGPSAPPDTSRLVLWAEVSVTASGTAFGPPHPPYVCPVSLAVGQETSRLIVFGPRRYKRALGGGLEPSQPEPFDGIAIGWDRAYGGGYEIPPGLAADSGLPHPGIRAHHPLNPFGMGFYPHEQAATDQPLPHIERPDQLIKRWSDQPTPAGFSPCPELNALRLPRRNGGRGKDLPHGSAAPDPAQAMAEDAMLVAARIQHHAPGDLVFALVPAGTPVRLAGLGLAPLRFEVPASPVTVRTRGARRAETVPPRLRSLHIDGDSGTLTVVYDHTFDYHPENPPSWIRVGPAP